MEKIERNQKRDQEVWRKLEAKGWSVVIIWECELREPRFEATVDRVEEVILDNGRVHEKHQQERRRLREQRLVERREQKKRLILGGLH